MVATKSFTAEADLQANICLKIGLGRETFSCSHKGVRLILWKALQSGRALFRLEDYYIVQTHFRQTSAMAASTELLHRHGVEITVLGRERCPLSMGNESM